jgi:hypothetical protein
MAHIPPTDLHTHRIRLREGTQPWVVRSKKRLTPNQEYWFTRIISEGLACGMYKRVPANNDGQFSS